MRQVVLRRWAYCAAAAISVFAIPAGRTATAPAADVKVHRGLAYAKPEDPQQRLDVYAPTVGQRLPVVLWIHGGGWHRGDKADVDQKPQEYV